jgi:hypothetical protein
VSADTEGRLGTLTPWRGECGHSFVVYSLESTPQVCPDCADKNRKFLADIIKDIGKAIYHVDCEGLPSSDDELDNWFNDEGLEEQRMRDDIHKVAQVIDEARFRLDQAETMARKLLEEKYPKAERLEMP